MLLKERSLCWECGKELKERSLCWESRDNLKKSHDGLHSGLLNASISSILSCAQERWGAGVETQKNVRGEIGGWVRVPFNETYAPSLSTIYDGA